MTVPYYRDERVTLYHGDCRDVLPVLKRDSIDVVLTDPPFFMPATHYQSRNTVQRSWGDTSILAMFWATVLDHLLPTLRHSGHLLAFCNGDSYPVFYPETYRRFDAVRSLVWDKGRIGMGSPWRNQHELVIAARWEGAYRNEERGCPDVIHCAPVPTEQRKHPVDKPLSLLSAVIKPVAPAKAVLLDPFAGGGSTLDTAVAAGHTAIGIETEEQYCEAIARRFDQGTFDFREEAS